MDAHPGTPIRQGQHRKGPAFPLRHGDAPTGKDPYLRLPIDDPHPHPVLYGKGCRLQVSQQMVKPPSHGAVKPYFPAADSNCVANGRHGVGIVLFHRQVKPWYIPGQRPRVGVKIPYQQIRPQPGLVQVLVAPVTGDDITALFNVRQG